MSENETITFHNPDAVSRISLWANIISWVILAFALINVGYQLYQIIPNWEQIQFSLPPSIFERIAIFATQVFYEPLVGVVYFLVLRGISQGLALLQDILYLGEEEYEVIETAH